MERKKMLRGNEGDVKEFECSSGNQSVNIKICQGIIIEAHQWFDIKNSVGHYLHDNCTDWELVARILLVFRSEEPIKYSNIRGLLDRSSEEYQALRNAMKTLVDAKIKPFEKQISSWESILNDKLK